ncbi:type VII toxin-antitoxin system MntA family adenylyltransferase antitoxin [Psychrilyobacter atlanticus]|uniref:type VII toxin-antitoxin system MntA family adenylyltransferase antitoxin n=1 Tax=Psychrilyobacter atlanticus TaxID=271091 RepID=UPI0003F8C978|nr:nucleotidyltransferase domain-containing protein [Psychrilyobacter atlanticus]
MTIQEKIVDYFLEKKPKLIYLFGSYAKNINREESDIDIAVLLGTSMESKEKYKYKIELVDLLGKEVDLIDLTDANIILKHQIVTTGKNLFCRTKLERDEFKYAVISCYYQYKEDIDIVKKSIKKRGHVWKK